MREWEFSYGEFKVYIHQDILDSKLQGNIDPSSQFH